MLRNWKWPHWSRRKARPAAVAIGDDPAQELSPGPAVSRGWESVSLLVGGADSQPTPLALEVDDGLTVSVLLNEQNAGLILETTQRAREYREREKSSIPPVYNFGGEPHWPGGGD
jgi:hypothetical protein